MDTDIVAVVDENDEVIGYRERGEVHRLGLKHRAVHILVFNRRGDLLLQKRSLSKDVAPGLWDSSAAGHVDGDEGYDDCALRELEEELGIRPAEPLERLFKLDARAENGWEFVWVYRCVDDGPFTVDRREIDAIDWFPAARLRRELAEQGDKFAGTVPLIWRRLMDPARS